jgi:hypothetical protein
MEREWSAGFSPLQLALARRTLKRRKRRAPAEEENCRINETAPSPLS